MLATSALRMLGRIPAWAWLALAVAQFLACCSLSVEVHKGRAAAARAQAAEQRARGQMQADRADHAEALREEASRVLMLERDLSDYQEALRMQDAEHRKIVDGLRTDLHRRARAGGGGGLRDPHATSCAVAASAPAASAPGGAGDAAVAGGLVSEPLEQLLLVLAVEADTINRAYIACRADALNIRRQLSPALLEPGPQAPGSP